MCAPQRSPISNESQLVKLRALVACDAPRRGRDRCSANGRRRCLGEDLRGGCVLAKMDHLGAGIDLLPSHFEDRDGIETRRANCRRAGCSLGYFQVMAEPVSTCVQLILELRHGNHRAW